MQPRPNAVPSSWGETRRCIFSLRETQQIDPCWFLTLAIESRDRQFVSESEMSASRDRFASDDDDDLLRNGEYYYLPVKATEKLLALT